MIMILASLGVPGLMGECKKAGIRKRMKENERVRVNRGKKKGCRGLAMSLE